MESTSNLSPLHYANTIKINVEFADEVIETINKIANHLKWML